LVAKTDYYFTVLACQYSVQ